MEPKRANLELWSLLFRLPKTASIFYRFLSLFRLPPGLPLASLLAPFGSSWPPFWLPLAPFGLLCPTFCPPLASFRLPWGCFEPPKLFIASGSNISARSCRDLAEILPRTCQELAKNQPRTRRMNLKQNCLSHCNFSQTASSADKPFHKIA